MSAVGGSNNETGPDLAEHIELSMPALPELLVLARMTAATVASRADFGYDQVEDLRLAIDELCLRLVGAGKEGRLHIDYALRAEFVEIVVTYHSEDNVTRGYVPESAADDLGGGGVVNELSGAILDALVDEHGIDDVSIPPRAWLKVRRRGPDVD
jgi:anti-sigma regulatory factor (Ser/Thr protein kinase)